MIQPVAVTAIKSFTGVFRIFLYSSTFPEGLTVVNRIAKITGNSQAQCQIKSFKNRIHSH